MNFELSCGCGQVHTASEGSAGGTLACTCGQSIHVPDLATLRINAGLPAVPLSPDREIQGMIDAGELPGTKCVSCGCHTSDHVTYAVECERLYRKATWDSRPLYILQILLVPLGMMVGFLSDDEGEVTLHGRETDIRIPLAVCQTCKDALLPQSYSGVFVWLSVIALPFALFVGWGNLMRGAIILAVGALFMLLSKALQARHQQHLRRGVACLPSGQALLDRYPDAKISLPKNS